MSKVNFAIDRYELIEKSQDSQLAKMRMYIVSEGNNRHNLPITKEAIRLSKSTLKGKPVLCKYDERFDVFLGHEKDEIPVGVFLHDEEIVEEEIDGKMWLRADCYLWKKLYPQIINVLKQQNGKTNISMEIEVLDSEPLKDGSTQINAFSFAGVTMIGVEPAIVGSKGMVMKFSEMVEETEKILVYENIDFSIPKEVKEVVSKALQDRKTSGKGGSVGVSTAKYILDNDKIDENKIKHLTKFFSRDDVDELTFQLYGGNLAKEWIENLRNQINFAQEEKMAYKKISEVNPAIRGIDPPVSLAQANAIARQADAIGTDDEKNGWAIAISSFKKTHKVEDGKWVKKTEMAKEETDVMEEDKVNMEQPQAEVMSEDEPREEEAPKKEGEEEGGDFGAPAAPAMQDDEFSLDSYLDVAAALEMLEEETESNREIVGYAIEELKKPEGRNYAKMVAGMYAKMSAMFAKMKEMKVMMAEKEQMMSTYSAENKSLKDFKADIEKQQFDFAVATSLKEVEGFIPGDVMEQLKTKSLEFSLETIDTFKNMVKAKAFEFSAKKPVDDGIKRYGLPFVEKKVANKSSLWG